MTRRFGLTLGHLFLIVWTILAIVPFILIVLFSFRNNTGIYSHPFGIGGSYELKNYTSAIKGPADAAGVLTYTLNTAIAAVVALVVNLAAGSTAAYFATKLSRRLRQLFVGIFVVGQVIPQVLFIIPYFQVYNAVGMLSNPPAIGVAYGVLALPTTVLILHSYFADFPGELIEAATVDGLSEFKAYLRIVLPLSKGALTAVGMLALIYVWGEAQLGIVLLQSASSQTLTVGMLNFQGQFSSNLGPIFAGLSIGSIPLIVLYLIFNRFVTKGIALGGVFR